MEKRFEEQHAFGFLGLQIITIDVKAPGYI